MAKGIPVFRPNPEGPDGRESKSLAGVTVVAHHAAGLRLSENPSLSFRPQNNHKRGMERFFWHKKG